MTFFRVLTVLSLLFHVPVLSAESPRNVGFYYGHESPIGPLFAYDWLVLQPDQATDARLSLLSREGLRPWRTLRLTRLPNLTRFSRK